MIVFLLYRWRANSKLGPGVRPWYKERGISCRSFGVTIPKDLIECYIQNELQYSKFIEERPSYTKFSLPLKQNWKLCALVSTTFYSALGQQEDNLPEKFKITLHIRTIKWVSEDMLV